MTNGIADGAKQKGWLITPRYLQDFKCIGSRCADTCCAGWQVSIDKKTFKSYQRIKDGSLRKSLQNHIKPVRSADRSEGNFARIVMDKDGACPLLQDSLCRIQREAGESLLSQTCATYPRITNVVDGIYSRFLTPSCPEATRLMLERDDSVDLEIRELSIDMPFDARSGRRWGLSVDFSKMLHTSILELLRMSDCPAWQRLSAVMLLGHLVHTALQRGDGVQAAEELLRTMAAGGPSIELLTTAAVLPGHRKAQFEIFGGLWKAHAHRFLGGSKLQQAVMRDIADQCEQEIDRPVTLESLTLDRYQSGLSILNGFHKSYPYLITNYLINEFARNAFPLGSGGASLWRECQSVASRYGILRFMLAMRAERLGSAFGVSEFAETIVVFTKRLEHNPKFSDIIKNCFEAAKVDDPSRVLKLLRDEDSL
jgi:lysine-N-methylase